MVTLDRSLGDLDPGDVLIEDGRIAEVGVDLEGGDWEQVDAGGRIVLPGFVDTHRHTWQTAMRGICADWTLLDYFRGVRLNIAQEYRPEDMYAGNLAGALEALDAGVTTILDFSHCNNSPDHADQALAGLRDAGLRATFAYGFYPVPLAEPHFSEHSQRLDDARRIRADALPADDGLLRMGVALTELGIVPFSNSRAEIALAGELDVLLTTHVGTVTSEGWPDEIELLAEAGLLGPGQVHVHCNACSDAAIGLIADAGAAVSVTPETELQMGMGFPVTGRALERGLRPSLGCDIVSNQSGDMLGQLRLALQVQRALDNQRELDELEMPERLTLGARDALEMATVNGAAALGLDSRIGTLSPGKEADVILVSTERLGMAPVNDALASAVLQARPDDVETVLVGGRVVKRDGELVEADAARATRLVKQSRDRIIEAMEARGGLLLEMPDGWFEATKQAFLQNLKA